jgi:hypothetical protein
MVALLPEFRVLVWCRCHLDACRPRNLFTGKMLTAPGKAICMPKTVSDEYSLEIAGSVGDTLVDEPLNEVSRNASLSECWQSVYRTG